MSPKARGPGRPRKFSMGDVARIKVSGLNAVVVDYKANPKDSYYQVVRQPVKQGPIWLSSTALNSLERRNTDVLRIYRANERLIDRGCTCNCCVHQAVPRRFWREDVDG